MHKPDPNRGTGRTTRQLKALQYGGFFVVEHHRQTPYVHNLCGYIGRPDIRVIAKDQLLHLLGLTVTEVAIDHDVDLSAEEHHRYRGLKRSHDPTKALSQAELDHFFQWVNQVGGPRQKTDRDMAFAGYLLGVRMSKFWEPDSKKDQQQKLSRHLGLGDGLDL